MSTADNAKVRVHAVLWNVMGPGSVAHALTALLDNLPRNEVDLTLWCLRRDKDSPRDYQKSAFPEFIYRALCRLGLPFTLQGRLARAVALRSIGKDDIVYVWPPYDLGLIKGARKKGAIVIAERTNCMGEMVRTVLTKAFARRGKSLPEGWCAQPDIDEDRTQMLQSDFVTAANPFVAQSARDSGVAPQRILDTFYGFDETRLSAAIGASHQAERAVFAFVGMGIIRKGLDVLLEAWEEANPDATLLIAGNIDENLRKDFAQTLARPDVKDLGFVTDVAKVYADADIFVFPTHEEGGPQVTYEAAACGLACLVSPMGAGRIVNDGIEGMIVDPLNVTDLAQAIARLAQDRVLRRQLGTNAARSAQSFTWQKAAIHLLEQFKSAKYQIQHGQAV